jgi:hypothetical protein
MSDMSEQEVTAREDIEALVRSWPFWTAQGAVPGERMLDISVDDAVADLHRWLAAHDEGVRAAERERLAAAWEEVDGPDRVRRPPFRPWTTRFGCPPGPHNPPACGDPKCGHALGDTRPASMFRQPGFDTKD